MAKHTPGPWLVNEDDPCEILIDDSATTQVYALIATVEAEGTSPEQAMADARLIAAAPDLLASLAEMVDQQRNGIAGISPACLARADAALAKAGEQ